MKIELFVQMVGRQFEKGIKVITTDNAKDFVNSEVQNFYVELRIVHETSYAYTPQKNEVVERRIGFIQEKGSAFSIHSNTHSFLLGPPTRT